MPDGEQKNVSHHILPTSANLMGLCFILISSIRAFGIAGKTLIDDVASIAMFAFLFSSIFSYVSMRNKKKAIFYEKIADIVFMSGLGLITVVSFLLLFELIH